MLLEDVQVMRTAEPDAKTEGRKFRTIHRYTNGPAERGAQQRGAAVRVPAPAGVCGLD